VIMTYYERRKQAGLCVDCGKSSPLPGKLRCRECADRKNEKARNDYYWYQEQHICPCCRKTKLIGDEKICLECGAKRYALGRKQSENGKKREQRINRENKRRSQGLCPRCGGTVEDGYVFCKDCRSVRKKIRLRQYRRKHPIIRVERPSYGLCFLCGEPLDTDMRICSSCHDAMMTRKKGGRPRLMRIGGVANA